MNFIKINFININITPQILFTKKASNNQLRLTYILKNELP